jgi:glycosyltransferase involved in cell wall biosynthesis
VILGLFTGLLASGGIERMGRHAAATLTSLAGAQRHACVLLSLNDPAGSHSARVADTTVTVRGFGRDKVAFSLSVLRAAPRTRLVYVGHVNLGPLGLVVHMIRRGAPYWVAVYGIEVWEPLSFVRRLSLRRATGVIPMSRFTGDRALQVHGLDRRRLHVVPPALDPTFVTGFASNGHEPTVHERTLLTVARLDASERYKGIDEVIRALPQVVQEAPDVRYVVVGDGDDRPRLSGLARELGVEHRVLFRTGIDDQELERCYQTCDVFVMPSRAEGMGLAFLEAMAHGKPVVGGNHGGTPDVVTDGVYGFLVQHGDRATLVERLTRLLRDEALRRTMGQAGRSRVLEDFSLDKFVQRLTALLTTGS